MSMDSRSLHRLALSSLLVSLAIVAVKLGAEPISLYRNVDPRVFVERSTGLANTWEFAGRRDPIGRYVPIAILFAIFGPSAQIASTYSAVMSYVMIPLTLYLLFSRVSNTWVGVLSVAGFTVWRLVGIGTIPYNKGSWQYDNTIPFVYLAFYATHSAIVQNDAQKRLTWAAITGVCVGVAGLTQYTLTAFTVVTVSAAYLYNRRLKELVVTGGVGSLFGVLILLFPGATGNQGPNLIDRVIRDPTVSASEIASEVVHLLTTPGLVLFVLLGVCAVLLYQVAGSTPAESNVIVIAVAIAGSVWLAVRLLDWGYIQWVASIFGQYLLIGLCADLAVKAVMTKVGDRVAELRSFVDSRTGLVSAVLVVAAASMAFAFVSLAPGHLQ